MKKIYVSTEDTKARLGVDDSAIRKLRAIYRREGRLRDRELFSADLFQELQEIVNLQRSKPHSSFEAAYQIVINAARARDAEAARVQTLLDRIYQIAPDDLTPLAGLVMGDEALERFFDLFNQLSDFLKPYDEDAAKILVDLQSLILAKIIMSRHSS